MTFSYRAQLIGGVKKAPSRPRYKPQPIGGVQPYQNTFPNTTQPVGDVEPFEDLFSNTTQPIGGVEPLPEIPYESQPIGDVEPLPETSYKPPGITGPVYPRMESQEEPVYQPFNKAKIQDIQNNAFRLAGFGEYLTGFMNRPKSF